MYRENKNFGFGDLAIGNKDKNGAIVDATIISSSRRPKKIDDLVTEMKRRKCRRDNF